MDITYCSETGREVSAEKYVTKVYLLHLNAPNKKKSEISFHKI